MGYSTFKNSPDRNHCPKAHASPSLHSKERGLSTPVRNRLFLEMLYRGLPACPKVGPPPMKSGHKSLKKSVSGRALPCGRPVLQALWLNFASCLGPATIDSAVHGSEATQMPV